MIEITEDLLKKLEETAIKSALVPTIAIKSGKGINNIPYAFRDSLNEQYIGYEKIRECEEFGNFLVIDSANDKVTIYSLNEEDKMLKDYNNKIIICDWNTPLNIYNAIETEVGPVLFVRTLKLQSFYVYAPKFIKHVTAQKILDTSKWVMFFRDGSIYANFISKNDGREGYFEWKYGLKKKLERSQIMRSGDSPLDIYGHTYREVYNMYISKVIPRVVYMSPDFYYNTSIESNALYVSSWTKEPGIRSGKRQNTVEEYSKLDIIDNEIAQKAVNKNKDLALNVTSGYGEGEKGAIYKLDSDKNVILIKRFLKSETEEHARVYIDDKDVYYAFKNREGKWCSLAISKKHSKQFMFRIDFFDEYDENMFKGTLLEYIYPVIRDKKDIFTEHMLEGSKIYAFTRNPMTEELLSSGVMEKLRIDSPDPGTIEMFFGKVDTKKKGFYKKIGLTKKQLNMMIDLALEIAKETTIRLGKNERSFDDNMFNYRLHGQFEQIVEYFKMIFSENGLEYDKKKEVVNISNVDEETFEKILNIFKSLSVRLGQSSYELGYTKTYGRAVAQLLTMFKNHYSNKAFLHFIDYLPKIIDKTIKVKVDRYNGTFIMVDKYIINYYIDYLKMLVQSQECRNFPWRFENPKDIKEAHDNFIPIFNRFMDFQKSPEGVNEKIAARYEKMEKYFYNNEEFMITYPKSGIEIIDEGRELRHCVGSYVKRVADGHTDIFFIRRIDNPEKPFFTLELQNSCVRQVHGLANSSASSIENLVDFIKDWAKKNKVSYRPEKSDRALAVN